MLDIVVRDEKGQLLATISRCQEGEYRVIDSVTTQLELRLSEFLREACQKPRPLRTCQKIFSFEGSEVETGTIFISPNRPDFTQALAYYLRESRYLEDEHEHVRVHVRRRVESGHCDRGVSSI